MSRMERKEIEQETEGLLQKTDGFLDGRTQIVGVARKLGFFVGISRLAEGAEGIIAVDTTKESLLNTGRNKVIVVDSALEKSRRRFMIAHELGHYHLRKNPDEPVFALRESSHGRNDQENEADFFAACILMPKKEFLAGIQKVCNAQNISKENLGEGSKYKIADVLSKQFGVPQLAALRRIGEVLEQ